MMNGKKLVLLLGLSGLLYWLLKNRDDTGATGANVIESAKSAGSNIVEATKQLFDPTRRLIERLEGRRNYAYLDSAGKWTIGVGHLITSAEGYLQGYTQDNPAPDDLINQLFDRDVAKAKQAVQQIADLGVPLNDNQKAALTSLAFNIGVTAFNSSTLVKKLRALDFSGAAAEFDKWIYAGGRPVLVSRRAEEKAVFTA